MKFPFKYKNYAGLFVYIPILDSAKLLINGKEIPKINGEWKLNDGTVITRKIFGLMFPTLMVNDKEEIKIINLQKWEWIFVLLPLINFFFIGLIPGLVSFTSIFINLSIFISPRINKIVKIVLSIAVFFLGMVFINIFSSLLRR